MAHPMEEEYVMLETFTEAEPGAAADPTLDAEVATVDSPIFAPLNEEADAASMALRHAEGEAARGAHGGLEGETGGLGRC